MTTVSSDGAPAAGDGGSAKLETSRLAVAALLSAVVGPLTCGLGGIVGFCLAIVAIVQIGRSRGRLKGIAAAICAILLSVALSNPITLRYIDKVVVDLTCPVMPVPDAGPVETGAARGLQCPIRPG
jgi:hypothetical protein